MKVKINEFCAAKKRMRMNRCNTIGAKIEMNELSEIGECVSLNACEIVCVGLKLLQSSTQWFECCRPKLAETILVQEECLDSAYICEGVVVHTCNLVVR